MNTLGTFLVLDNYHILVKLEDFYKSLALNNLDDIEATISLN